MSLLTEKPPPEGGEGWYRDPLGSTSYRYFDGAAWTDRIRKPTEAEARADAGAEAKARADAGAEAKARADAGAGAEAEAPGRSPGKGLRGRTEELKAEADELLAKVAAQTDPSIAAEVAALPPVVRWALGDSLADGEIVRAVIPGYGGQAILGTETRAIVVKQNLVSGFLGGHEVTTWGYRNIVGVQMHKEVKTGAVLIQVPGQSGNRTNTWGTARPDDPVRAPNAIPIRGKWREVRAGVATLRQLIDDFQTGAERDGDGPDRAALPLSEELAKLGELHATGVLSDEEFATAKSRLIGS